MFYCLLESPPTSWFKVNTDGACNQSTLRSAAGGVIRNDEGRFELAFFWFLGRSTSLIAELKAIWKGLKLCKELNLTNVIVETDSTTAIALIKKSDMQWNWKMGLIVQNILDLTKHMCIVFSHVYREGNKAADHMANIAINSRSSGIWRPGDCSIPFRQLMYQDKIGAPYLRRKKIAN